MDIDEKDRELLRDIEDTRLESSLMAYLSLISNISLLSAEEVDRLISIYRDARQTEEARQGARERLILANTRLVVNIAKQYYSSGIHLMDLISEGTIGLMVALDKYDATKGFRLSTYATWWIRQRILRYIINNQSLIRVPEHIIDKINRLNRAADEFRKAERRDPELEDLANATGFTKDDVERYTSSVPSILSIDDTPGSDENDKPRSLQDKISDGVDIIQQVQERKLVQQMLRILEEKECMVIMRRYGIRPDGRTDEPSTLDELAGEMCLSRERVRQIEHGALKKIKREFLVRK
jgi:RNA polymerase sigma factor (sigma-70 family)